MDETQAPRRVTPSVPPSVNSLNMEVAIDAWYALEESLKG